MRIDRFSVQEEDLTGSHPGADTKGIDPDAEQVGRNEPKLSSPKANDADDGAVQARDSQARPAFSPNQNCGENRKAAGQII